MEELQKLLGLIRSEDPELRRYALSSMETLPGAHEEDELLEALRLVANDPIPLVRHQANRTLTAMLSRKFAIPRPPKPTDPGGPVATDYEGIPIARLQEAGYQLLAPLVAKLSAVAVGKDADPARRAVMALGRIGTAECVDPLKIASVNPVTCDAAIAALARMEVPRAAASVMAAARHDIVKVKAAGLLNLGRLDRPEARDLIFANSSHGEPLIRSNVANALSLVTEKEKAVKVLTRMLGDDVNWVALDAVRSLSFFNTPEAVKAVCQAYRERQEPDFQATCVASLGFMKSTLGVDVLTEALRTSNTRIRANAVESLGKLPLTPQDLARILAPTEKDVNNRVRGNLAVVMVRWAPQAALALLSKMIEAEDVWMRATAAWALGRARVGNWAEILTRKLAEEQEFPVLSQALRSLEASPELVNPDCVYPLLDHSFAAIRSRAATLLGLMKADGIATVLCKKTLGEPDALVRSSLVTAIGRVGSHSDLGFLNDLLMRDPEPRVKASAVEALGTRRGLVQVVQLYSLLASTDHRLKANVAIVLFSMGGFRVIDSLMGMLEAMQPRHFAAAAFAVGELGARLRLLGYPDASVHLLAGLRTLVLREQSRPADGAAEVVDVLPEAAPPPPPPAAARPAPPAEEPRLPTPPGPPAPQAPLPPPPRVQATRPEFPSMELAIERVITALLTSGPVDAQRVATELLKEQSNPMVEFLMQRVRAGQPGAQLNEEALIRVAETLPDYVEPAVDLVQLYTARRSVQELIECYVVMYERQLALLGEQLQVVRQLAQEGKFEQAMAPIGELAGWVPVTAGGHRRVGRTLLAAGDRDRAFHHLFLAHLSTFWDFESTYDYAVAAVHNAQLDLARELCGQILKMAPAVHPVVERTRALMAQLGS